MQPQFVFRFIAALLLCAVGPALCMAQAGQPFYKGRTITLVVPTSPGGINDLAGRLVARHLGRFIPGNPTIVVENVPGGAGIIAANRLANTIEKDGLTIAIIQRGTPQVADRGRSECQIRSSETHLARQPLVLCERRLHSRRQFPESGQERRRSREAGRPIEDRRRYAGFDESHLRAHRQGRARPQYRCRARL